MTDNVILEAIQKFMEENICPKIKLQKPSKGNKVDEYDLVNPAVHIGWVPPPESGEIPPIIEGAQIPCYIIGMDDGQDDGNQATINIRITAVAYNQGFYDGSTLKVDFKGYQDVLNLITLARREYSSKVLINGITSINKPMKWGIYKDQPAPFWYGWITFSVNVAVMEYVPCLEEM